MQRLLLCVCLLFAITLPCAAQGDKAKPNTLTPKEIADGWILLFDGETTFGWSVQPPFQNEISIKEGALNLSRLNGSVRTNASFGDLDLTFEYKNPENASIVGVWSAKKGGVMIDMPKTEKWATNAIQVRSGRVHYLKEGPKTAFFEWPHETHIQFHGRNATGHFIRNIKLRPLNTTPLYNGKDLTGWKTFPGDKYKSKFSVNDKGELNVKDGPGDLQTVGKYKDFILQLECISNGKHLNSGIFFRCRDGEYQNGYEAQIRNQFTKDPTQKYLIEEYDPKTNKLVGKKELMGTAFDFGTGAIYRRVPARKEMSKDGEWFSMTIAAQGNHFATWVNGVQVTDWTDNRPKSDNARTGCRLEAGHLSIQGHDPTTDLSFRNLRIVETK